MEAQVGAHGATEGDAEGVGVGADFALDDDGLFVGVDELDGVLDGDDVLALGVVDVVHHGGEGGGLSGAGGSGDEDESAIVLADFAEDGWELEVVDGLDVGGDDAENGAGAEVVVHEVDAEAGESRDFVGEVLILVLEEPGPFLVGGDFLHDAEHFGGGDGWEGEGSEVAVDTGLGGHLGAEMEV